MNGELAQLCAIVAHAKAFLAPATRDFGSMDPQAHSTFKFVARTEWYARPRALGLVSERVIAGAPNEWFEHLLKQGAASVNLVAPGVRSPGQERTRQSFNGGGTWGVEVAAERGGVGHWIPVWRPREETGSVERPWLVTYRERVGTKIHAPLELGDAMSTLREALQAVLEFARGLELEDWVPTFDQALKQLESPDPFAPYHPDMLPRAGYALPARRLCAAAQQAWVFGGMGSWNEVMVEDGDTSVVFEEKSDHLYRAVVGALLAAIEAFDPEDV